MKQTYLIFAIVGTIVPYVFFGKFFLAEGINLIEFVQALFVNGAAGGFTADLLIASAVFWVYMLGKKEPKIWLFILLNMTIGLSCALPAYLYTITSRAEDNL
tara:strand:+ start:1525 stop:1830 length:306 start_codon:yes stop_codon:yes gene_type:complete